MILRFNGAQNARESGCACQGKKTKTGVTYSKSYILPSGKAQTFHTGREYEVSERDARFLLAYTYKTSDGVVHPSFEKV